MPKYSLQLDVSKEDMLALNNLAGQGVSIREYMGKVIHEHVVAQQARTLDVLWDCANCENREIGGGFAECPNCGAARR